MEAAASIRAWEGCAFLLVALAAFLLPRALDKRLDRLEAPLKKFAYRPALSLIAVAFAAVLLRLALQPVLHTPEPGIHDEFSYLLAADTFLHGRVANPPHPFWKFFESFHILQQPTYASMYPPAQGLFLAVGTLLTGHAYGGVLLSAGLLCMSLLWMLRAWMPPHWALLGAALAIVRISLFSYWGNSFWGGAPAAIGGALVAGSIPRIFESRRTIHAILLGLGLVLLAASRPVEGLFFCVPFAFAFLLWLFPRENLRAKLTRAALPVCVILLPGAAALAYYNWRITGNAFEPPQVRNMRQYSSYGVMLWDKGRPQPQYNNQTMQLFYVYIAPGFEEFPHSLTEVLKITGRKILVVYNFFLGPLLVVPLIAVLPILANRKLRLLLLAIVSLGIGVLCERWQLMPHYFAPATCLIYALVLFAMSDVSSWIWRDRPVGRFFVRGIVAAVFLMAIVRIFADPLGIQLQYKPQDWSATMPGNLDRAALITALSRSPERFLVIVRYTPQHHPDDEWVYNDADIDHSKIVWARDLGAQTNDLVRYFRDRRPIVIEPDVNPTRTRPYDPLDP